jgi:hypothetical protein
MTVSQLLSGNKPILIVHKSHQYADRLPRLFGYLQRTTGTDLELGAGIYLSRQDPAETRRYMAAVSAIGLRIADPELHAHADQRGHAVTHQKDHRYLVDPLPRRPESAWISAYLARQRDVGATALLTPTGWLPGADPQVEVREAMEWVRATRALNPSEPLLVSLALPRTWLETDSYRAVLLREIVDSNEPNWYVRVLWQPLTPRYGQLRDPNLLRGYQELAATASGEGKILILPSTGLLGWLATGWGASGLSAGLGMPELAFAEPMKFRAKKGVPQPPAKSRYFESMLLHTVDLDTHTRLLDEAQYVCCDCPYCKNLQAASPPNGNAWSREEAALHFMVQLARELSRLNVRNPRTAALREVKAARACWDGLAVKPIGENAPQHLDIWGQLLA